MLALTFSRKAAEQLRDRVTARLGRTLSSPISSTFHSFAYGLVRSHAPAELYAAPLRLLSAPEQDVLIQELLTGPESLTWPEPMRAAVRTRGFAAEVQSVLARAREKGLDPVDLAELGRSSGDEAYVVAASFMQRYLVVLDDMSAVDYADLIRRAVGIAEHNRDELRTRYGHVFVDEYQDTDPSQVALLRRAGRRRTQPRGRRRPRPVDLRLPRGRRQRHPPTSPRPSRLPTASRPRWSRCVRRAASAHGC